MLQWTSNAGWLVAADSGLQTAAACGIMPDLVVGDFDSLEDHDLLGVVGESKVRRYPHEKDYTDTELAVRAARDRGCTEIVIIGGGGGRMDHLIGILSLFDREPPPSVWITDTAVLQTITSGITIEGSPGGVVSLFPVGCESCRATSEGLRWPLDGLSWRRGDFGLSNELTSKAASIRVLEGRLLLVRELEAIDRLLSEG